MPVPSIAQQGHLILIRCGDGVTKFTYEWNGAFRYDRQTSSSVNDTPS